MTSSRTSKALLLVVAICLGILAFQVPFAGAQKKGAVVAPPPQKEEIPPDSDYMFRKYSAVIDQIKDKPDDLLAWVKANPKATRSIAYAAAYYGQAASAAMKTDPQKAIGMIQTFQAAAPGDKTLVTLEMSAYYQAKNYAKAAEIGEVLYAQRPSLEMANTLYTLYVQANNQDKVLAYGEKLLAEVGIEKGIGVALQMVNIHAQRKNNDKVLALFNQIMGAYGDKVPQGIQEGQWNATRATAFTLMAADSYAKKDSPKAIELYEKVIHFAPKGEEACQAWYYIGMLKWQGKDQKGAIEPFAKSFVIGKALSAKAKEYMEQLYKNENGGKLDGIDAVIAKAKSDLGIG